MSQSTQYGQEIASLPSWERGLKQSTSADFIQCNKSLPSWERGLKLRQLYKLDPPRAVAPFVGAWIETYWIPSEDLEKASLPSWERGLKLLSI